jgi:hypothetical protein
MMKAARIAFLALVCFVPLAASAQWMWVDKGGRKVFSDQPPPADVAPERILKQPGPRNGMVLAPVATPTTAAAAAPADAAANLPKPTGKDKVLDEKKKQMEAADADKKKAEEARVAALRVENCSRAKASKATYESGVRLTRVNKGEHEYLDDNQRAAEIKVLNDVIARDCRQ